MISQVLGETATSPAEPAPNRHRLRRPLALFAASLQLMIFRFLLPTPVGLADNGDGARLVCQLDVGGTWPTFEHVLFYYPPAAPCQLDYASSQLWLDNLAIRLGSLLGHTGFNLVDLGLICIAVASAGITLVAFAAPLPLRLRFALGGLLWLVVADSAFFGYFASVYSEAAALLGLLLVVAGILLLHRSRWLPWLGAALATTGGLLAANAKLQTLAIIVPLAIALVFWKPASRRGGMPLRGAVSVGLTAILVVGTVATQVRGDTLGSELREVNAHNTIFNGIVDGRHDTRGDLAALGLPAHFERYAGRTWWEEPAAHRDHAYAEYRDQVELSNITRFYLTHPVRTLQLLHRAATEMLVARVDYLGSYDRASGQPPRTLEYRVPIVSAVVAPLAPLGLFLVVPLWILLGRLAVRALRSGAAGAYEFGLATLFLLSAAVLLFGIAALAEGHEGTKHQTVTLYCTLLAGVLAATTVVIRRRSRYLT